MTVVRVPFDRFKSIIEMSLGRWWWGLPVWYSRTTRLSVRDRTMANAVGIEPAIRGG